MQDYLFDTDLQIENGDFVIGESDNQHVRHILTSDKGEYKSNPEIGVGIIQMLNDEVIDDFLIDAKKNLEYDGMTVNNISFLQDGKLNVDAKYKD